MYVWGDMSNNTPIGGPTQPWKTGAVFKENRTWQTGLPPEAGDLNAAPSALQPPLVKIYKIVTNSTMNPFTDHVYLCNPTPYQVDASKLYLQKDVPGDFNGPTVQVHAGMIGPFKHYYVDTGTMNYFVETGDAVKLVWKNNASDPQAPFNGRDIVIDRVEFNKTPMGGTLNWEPGNTIMNNEPAPDRGLQINRSASCRDTNSVQRDFFVDMEIIENIDRPDPPDPICIQGLCNWDLNNPALYHITVLDNFRINWTHHDPDGDPQGQANVRISILPNGGNTIWNANVFGATAFVDYAGLPLLRGTCYHLSVQTKDAGPAFGAWAELGFCTNGLPAPVNKIWPSNGWTTSAKPDQQVWWTSTADPNPGDLINYTWKVNTTADMGTPLYSGTTTTNTSIPFLTNPSSTYFWCVNASDGWEWVNGCASPWLFTTTTPLPAPTATELKVDNQAFGDAYLQRVTNLVPVLSWKFNPAGRLQTGFQVQVLRDSDSFVMWDFTNTGTGGDLSTATYNSDSTGTALSNGICYHFQVRVRDNLGTPLWSTDWGTPLGFCINTPPPTPMPLAPADDSVRLPGSTTVYWSAVTDADAGDVILYDYCIGTSDPPYPSCDIFLGLVSANNSVSFTTIDGGNYSWAVRAYDQHEYSIWSPVWNFTARLMIIPPPMAKAVGVSEALVGDPVTFYGNGSQGDISRYIWTVRDRDGAVVTELTGAIVSFAFTSSGTYSVTLTVYDDSTGLSDSDTFYILVKSVPKEGFDWLWLLILLAILFVIAPIGGTEIGRVALLTLLVAPMHGRKTKEKDEAETRGMIRGFILGNPGECYTSIKENLGLKNGTLSWHLMKLEKEGIIKSRVQGTRRRYYSRGATIPAENGGELREIEQRLLKAVEEDVGRSVKELAEELGVSSQLALYHIRRLSQKGFVNLERKGLRLRVYGSPDNRNT